MKKDREIEAGSKVCANIGMNPGRVHLWVRFVRLTNDFLMGKWDKAEFGMDWESI